MTYYTCPDCHDDLKSDSDRPFCRRCGWTASKAETGAPDPTPGARKHPPKAATETPPTGITVEEPARWVDNRLDLGLIVLTVAPVPTLAGVVARPSWPWRWEGTTPVREVGVLWSGHGSNQAEARRRAEAWAATVLTAGLRLLASVAPTTAGGRSWSWHRR
jgi:hypothetical protein